MPPTFSTYFSFSEFNGGTRATFDQFRDELSQFNGPAVVYVCSVMNAVITDWQGHYRAEAHDELVRNSFAPHFADGSLRRGGTRKIIEVSTTGGSYCSFPSKQFLCARKLAAKIPGSLLTVARWVGYC